MLKRLTDATSYCARIDCLAGRPGSSLCAAGTCYPRELYERLRYYEDLEEAGRYIVLAEPERAGVDRLRTLAQADVEGRVAMVVHGSWHRYSTTMMICTACGRHTARHKYAYCPHCGAKMDGGDENG